MIAALRLAGALYMEDAATSFALSRVDASFTNNAAGADGGNDSKGENKEMDRCKSLFVFVVETSLRFCLRAAFTLQRSNVSHNNDVGSRTNDASTLKANKYVGLTTKRKWRTLSNKLHACGFGP